MIANQPFVTVRDMGGESSDELDRREPFDIVSVTVGRGIGISGPLVLWSCPDHCRV
jgi:hypothetical protein